MTKEELGQIRFLNGEIKMWQRELDRKQCQSAVGSQVITGMPFGNGISDRVADMACDIVEIRKIIEGKLAEIQIQRKKIMEYITGINDSLMRQIIFYKHVSCMGWTEITLNIGGNNSVSSIKMAYKRFFDKQEKL